MRKGKLVIFVVVVMAVIILLSRSYWQGASVRDHHKQGQTQQDKAKKYHCPMHPTYISDKPGDCPICGMRLVPMGEEEPPQEFSGIPGYAPVKISPEKQQLIGVKKEKVSARVLEKTIRAVGIIGHNELKLYNFNIKFDGWIKEVG